MGKKKKKRKNFYEKVYACVKRVPSGKVATYGQIASIIGHVGGARQVGWALHGLSEDLLPKVPWHRIINCKGAISSCSMHSADLQRKLLETEGIVFDQHSRIDLKIFQWRALR